MAATSPNRRLDPADLPVYAIADPLVEALTRPGAPPRVVVVAPTGSGKSTQVPQILLDRGGGGAGEIVVLQPRRIAARLLARRVAWERGGVVGGEVGYQVRFERVCGRETRIRYVTEGVLLREMLDDPQLTHVGTIVFDEFHERHLYGDITLARALDIQESGRPDLGVVVMSATLEADRLAGYLGDCPVVRSEGRTFPVEVGYAPPRIGLDPTLPEQVVRACGDALAGGGAEGNVLVFLPGGHEIRKTVDLLKSKRWTRGIDVLPLYGDLPPEQQDAAVAGGDRRRIVVSTNVAETSLTIADVRTVIDSGLARVASYDVRRGINTLTVQKISRASADQRAGRAGRTAPGVAIRLWSERDHAARAAAEPPEVLRLDLAEVALGLRAMGVGALDEFRWLDPPGAESLASAERLLADLGAVSDYSGEGKITPEGRQMVRFPVHPRFARVLLAAAEIGCLQEAALAIALAQGRGIFAKRQSGGSTGVGAFASNGDTSDFTPQIRAWHYAVGKRFDLGACRELGVHAGAAREAAALYRQILGHCVKAGVAASGVADERSANPELLGKALLAGFPDHLARRTGSGSSACDVAGGRRGQSACESIVRGHPLLVASEITEVEGRELKVLLSNLTVVEEAWLEELFPGAFEVRHECTFDPVARRVQARESRVFRDLVLEQRERGEPDRDQAAALLAHEVTSGNLVLKKWDHAVEQWIARVNCLAAWMPELAVPPLTDDDREFLIAQTCSGAKSYREIKERSPWPVLRTWLSAPQLAALDHYTPERITLSNGRSVKVSYTAGESPRISAQLQHLYDVVQNPTVAAGSVPVVTEVLAPNRRPVQVTSDLAAFWESSYPEVKRQLKGRYPKHEWR